MSWMKSFFGKSSNIAQKVKGNKFVPSLGGQLEDRKLLATVTASAGSYTVIVSTITNPKYMFDGNIVATLKIGSKTIKAHAGLQGGDRNICNMLLSSDLPLALVLCTNSKKPI